MRRPDSAAFAQALADPPALLSQPPSLLSDEQVDALDRLIEPLSPDQLIWIGGYLAGLATARRAGTPRLAPAPADDDEAFVTIVYGSQSGNSAGIALVTWSPNRLALSPASAPLVRALVGKTADRVSDNLRQK